MKIKILLIALFTFGISSAQDTPQKVSQDSIQKLDEVLLKANVIFGNKYQAKNRTGSSYYISPKEMAKFNYTDINRLLRTVPGVNI